MYKVFQIEKGQYQIFWCPSAPTHYSDKVPYSDHIYRQRQGAHRRCSHLNQRLMEEKKAHAQQSV